MLAGLLFATHDAEDRPAMLTATLPFGGVTLIEYQARLLIESGAMQIVVMTARLTPELLAAIGRIGRRGVAVDPVQSAAEAAETLHPLAPVLMLADGLVTSRAAIAPLAVDGRDVLLVVDESHATRGFERLGRGLVWAGAARVEAQRVVEVAALPSDYDFQSTLIRVAAQAQAQLVTLPSSVTEAQHGIEHAAAMLDRRGRATLIGIASDQRGWFDRFVAAPLIRLVLPPIIVRRIDGGMIGLGAGAIGLLALAAIGFAFTGTGLVLALVATIGFLLAATVAEVRDDATRRVLRTGAAVLPGLAVLGVGALLGVVGGDSGARAIALALVVAAALAERAIRARRRWLIWGSPGGYLLIVAVATLVQFPVAGLTIAALYAAATLASAIEDLQTQA